MTPIEKLAFFLRYLAAKLRVPLDTRSPRFAMTLYEIRYTLANVLRSLCPAIDWKPVWYAQETLIDSKFGRLRIRRGTQDAAIASPAFERADVEGFLREAKAELDRGSKLLFLDVGAHIGKFSIALLTRLRGRDVRAIAIEPWAETFRILAENRSLNGLMEEHMRLVQAAASDRAGEAALKIDSVMPGNSTLGPGRDRALTETRVPLVRLDDLGLRPSADESLLLKLDIEGSEIAALRGATGLLSRYARIGILIEDMLHGAELEKFLRSLGFERAWKKTVYNSFWRKGSPDS